MLSEFRLQRLRELAAQDVSHHAQKQLHGALRDALDEIDRQRTIIEGMEPKLNEITDFASKLQAKLERIKDRERPRVSQTKNWKPSPLGPRL